MEINVKNILTNFQTAFTRNNGELVIPFFLQDDLDLLLDLYYSNTTEFDNDLKYRLIDINERTKNRLRRLNRPVIE